MAALYRVRTALTGFPGAPGVSTMFALDVDTFLNSVHTFWSAVAPEMPGDVTMNVETSGDIIDDATGALVSAYSEAALAPIVGSASGGYAAPCGGLVRWNTATILDGRRLRGRTFIVPMTGFYDDAAGGFTDAQVAVIKSAADAFIAAQSASFVIWHRPAAARLAGEDGPARAAHAGGHGLVTGSGVTGKFAVLRSRRD